MRWDRHRGAIHLLRRKCITERSEIWKSKYVQKYVQEYIKEYLLYKRMPRVVQEYVQKGMFKSMYKIMHKSTFQALSGISTQKYTCRRTKFFTLEIE